LGARLGIGALATIFIMLGLTLSAVAPPAGANTVHDIAPNADSEGPVVVDSAGNGYVAWLNVGTSGNDDSVAYCKIPRGGTCTSPMTLPLPHGASWNDYAVGTPYPVVGKASGVISVVAPSYDKGNVVIWTSSNGGVSFPNPTVTSGYADNTSADDVLATPDNDNVSLDYFSIASHNPGLGYTFTTSEPGMDPPVGFTYGLDGVPGGVTDSTVGYGATINPGPSQETQTVEAFSTNANPNYLGYYWAPFPGSSGSDATENGPIKVTNGSFPRLAGGPDGLFLLSLDDGPTGSNNLLVDVRKWNGTTERFGAPTLVATVPADLGLEDSGSIGEDATTGALTVAWPAYDASGTRVIEVAASSNGTQFSAPIAVAVDDGYGGGRIATTGGQGFMTWQDDQGLELIDLPATTTDPYSPLSPVRICDTRPGNPSILSHAAAQCNGSNNAGNPLAANVARTINVAGSFGVPADASAVVLNVTAIHPSAAGYLSAYPAGAAPPSTSDINYATGSVVPNLIEVGTGTSGDVSFYSSQVTNIAVDVEGYTAPAASGGSGAGLYNPLPTPVRLCDTRPGNPSTLLAPDTQCNGLANAGTTLAAGGSIDVKVGGDNSIPSTATVAVLNVTAVGPTGTGYLTVYPQGSGQPTASNVNYVAGQRATGNRVIVPLSASGKVTVYSSASSDVLVDVSGYFSAAGGSGAQFTAESSPVRICDTRTGNPSGLSGANTQCMGKTIAPQSTLTVHVSTLAGIPTGAKAVVLNLTGVAPPTTTYLTMFPGPTLPTTSDINLTTGVTHANMVVATINTNGTVSIYNNSGSVNVLVDVEGWYS